MFDKSYLFEWFVALLNKLLQSWLIIMKGVAVNIAYVLDSSIWRYIAKMHEILKEESTF